MEHPKGVMRSTMGFTLVELIVTLIVAAILAVVVVPRFQTSSGYAEFTYQARLISSLRAMQQRAMQDTRDGFCFQVNIITGATPGFGPPTVDYTDDSAANQALTCDSTVITTDDGAAFLVATGTEMADANLSINGSNTQIRFSSLGCPITAGVACDDDYRVEITGEQTTAVCIEEQGYIYAC